MALLLDEPTSFLDIRHQTDEVFTYANLTAVFETEVYVDTNDLTGQLLVVPLSGRVRRELAQKKPG